MSSSQNNSDPKKGYFDFFNKDPDPKAKDHKDLWEHRKKQFRPLFGNPLHRDNTSAPSSDQSDGDQAMNQGSSDPKPSSPKSGDTMPDWLILIHDLAWTATFSSLNQNWTLSTTWSIVSYVVFFATVWWVWVTEVLYAVEYYRNDWMNVLFIFLQFIGFAVLASVTKDFDVTAFIAHTPGDDNLIIPPLDESQMTAEQYSAKQIAFNSIKIVTITIGALRLLLFVKYMRVGIYVKLKPNTSHPLKPWFFILPASLFVSAFMFISAHIVSSHHGDVITRRDAQLVWILWAMGIMFELFCHCLFEWKNNARDPKDPKDRKAFSGTRDDLVKRFGGITVIIISEGVNPIVSSFWRLQLAQTTSSIIAWTLFSCAIIIFLLAYLYFEGPCPSKLKRRRLSWCLVHLPWLLSITLLLYAIKTQILFLIYFDALDKIFPQLVDGLADLDPQSSQNKFTHILLRSGTTWSNEQVKLQALLNGTNAPRGSSTDDIKQVWMLRVFLDIVVRFCQNLTGDDHTSEGLQRRIDAYRANYTLTLSDAHNATGTTPELYGIWHAMVSTDLVQGQYFIALCGSTLIWLATLSLLQSRPKDRYHWGSVVSRYTMGIVMILLVLMNVGHVPITFPLGSPAQWGPMLAWMNHLMALPTIALAYAVQFIIDQVLLGLSVWSFNKQTGNGGPKQNQPNSNTSQERTITPRDESKQEP